MSEKSTPSTFREKVIKKIPLVIGRKIKMEKMESFIPMPQTHAHDDIIEIIEMKERIKKLEDKIQILSDRILELEHIVTDFHRDFVDHERSYDHRLL